MDIDRLKTELTDDLLARGYAGMTDAEAVVSLNTEDRTRVKLSMTGDAVFAATDTTEFGDLTDHKRLAWLALCGRSNIDPAGVANVALVNWVFGLASATLAALATARTDTISRAVELGLGYIYEGHIQQARAL